MHSDLSALEAAFDGPIPRNLRRSARNIPPVLPSVPAISQLPKRTTAQIVADMADVLADAHRRNGCATEGDLWAAGFPGWDITRHGPAAKRAALAELAASGIDVTEAA